MIRIYNGLVHKIISWKNHFVILGVTSRPQLKRTSGPDQRQALHTFHQELTETVKKDAKYEGHETIEHNVHKGDEPTTPMLRLVVEKVIKKTASTLTVDDASNLDSINFRNRADSRVCSALKIQLQRAIETSKRDVDRGMFQVGEQIGSGNFGQVYKGILAGLVNENSKTIVWYCLL